MSRAAETTWSRRRAAVQAEAEAERQAGERASIAQAQAGHEQKSDADILQELSLQDPDQMQSGDDFAAFMRAEVPERLRKRALRTLWRSNPVLACVDDLLDYGDDFKAEWSATGVIKTTYQVGKGMLAHIEEMERQKLAEDTGDEPVADNAEEVTEAGTAAVADEAAAPPDPPSDPAPMPDMDDETPQIATPRRMRFDFDGAA